MSKRFTLVAPYEPKGDQPKAIRELTEGVEQGLRYQTLLGATGSGKMFLLTQLLKVICKPSPSTER